MTVTCVKPGNVQRCRVRQGAGGVCPDSEFGSLDSGRTHFPRLKSRHKGAQPRQNPRYYPGSAASAIDQRPAVPQFPIQASKQNPLKTRPHTAV